MCPKVEDTCWLSLGNMCQWFGKHRYDFQEYLDQKKIRCMPEIQWWIYVAAVETIIKKVNIYFVVQYADFQEEENKAERYCWEDIAATLRI